MSWLIPGALAVVVVLGQGIITARLWRSDLYERGQKVAQSALVWLLPVMGAIVVYAGLRQQDDVSRPAPNLAGDDDDGPLSADDGPPGHE